MSPPPLPAPGQFIPQTRATARTVRQRANITVNTAAIDHHLSTISPQTFARLKNAHGVSSFPLNFTSPADELNFLAVLALLNTFSGYREPFHRATGQGAYQNVVKLLFGLYISGSGAGEGMLLSAKGMAGLQASTVEQIWGVSSYEERPHPSIPGVTVGERGGDMHDIVQMVVRTCNETGQVLLDAGYESLGQFVLEVLKEGETVLNQQGDAASADHIVEKIVTLIPGFRDMSTVLDPPLPIYIFKKAFFLIYAIHQRLSPSSSGSTLPRLPDPAVLPMFVDNVLPTMCLFLGFIDVSECTLPALRAWSVASAQSAAAATDPSPAKSVVPGPELTAEDAYVVRAAALDAGRIAIERVAAELCTRPGLEWLKGMTEADLDGYLWSVAKDDPALRVVPRMVERDTVMY